MLSISVKFDLHVSPTKFIICRDDQKVRFLGLKNAIKSAKKMREKCEKNAIKNAKKCEKVRKKCEKKFFILGLFYLQKLF